MDRGLCFKKNVSLIIQIWSGIILLNGGMYQAISEIESKCNKASLFNFGSHSNSGIPVTMYSYVVLIKNSKHKNCKTQIQRKHKPYIFLNKQRCWQNSMIFSGRHVSISAFEV